MVRKRSSSAFEIFDLRSLKLLPSGIEGTLYHIYEHEKCALQEVASTLRKYNYENGMIIGQSI
jgi:hypothetical protein